MKQIPYSDQKTSKLFHEIKSHIENFDTTIEIDLTDTHKDVDGYPGNLAIEINEDADFFLVEDFRNEDISRFPARIKATATALKFSGYIGKFFISHICTKFDSNNEVSNSIDPSAVLLCLGKRHVFSGRSFHFRHNILLFLFKHCAFRTRSASS